MQRGGAFGGLGRGEGENSQRSIQASGRKKINLSRPLSPLTVVRLHIAVDDDRLPIRRHL